MAKLNRSSMSIEEVVKNYHDTKEKYDNLVKRFDAIKKDFYSKMDEEMKGKEDITIDFFAETFKVKKVQKKQVIFDIGKLERSLDKETLKKVVVKKCSVINYDALISYFKELGADPKVIRELIVTTKEVDTSEIDRLAEIGEIDQKVIVDAATVVMDNHYYTVKKL